MQWADLSSRKARTNKNMPIESHSAHRRSARMKETYQLAFFSFWNAQFGLNSCILIARSTQDVGNLTQQLKQNVRLVCGPAARQDIRQQRPRKIIFQYISALRFVHAKV